MALPAIPEYDSVTAQLANLQQIAAGPDWRTDLGAGAGLYPISDESPVLSCWPSDISTGVDPDSSVGTIVVTWTAIVPLDTEDSTPALYVLADMRAALVGTCISADPREVGDTWAQRPPGSNYTTVTITVQSQMVSEGRSL